MVSHDTKLVATVLFFAVLINVGVISYWDLIVQKRINDLEQTQSAISVLLDNMYESPDDSAMVIDALRAENKTYRATLKRQRINLKECMSKLPQSEIDDFYRRHREELQQGQTGIKTPAVPQPE